MCRDRKQLFLLHGLNKGDHVNKAFCTDLGTQTVPGKCEPLLPSPWHHGLQQHSDSSDMGKCPTTEGPV